MKKKSKAENTHKAMKLWNNCLQEFLTSNGLGNIDEIEVDSLPKILENFSMEIRKMKKQTQTLKVTSDQDGDDDVQFKHKNNSLKAM